MRTPRRVLVLTAMAATSACHRGASPGASPATSRDTTASITITRPVCPSGAPEAAWVRWPVDTVDTARPVAIRLPPRFRPVTARRAARHRWEAPDSSAIELWLSDAPVLSVGGSRVAQFGGEVACTLAIGGRPPAIVVRYWVIFAGRHDTLYNAATATTVAPRHAVNVELSSHTRPARDELLGALADLQLPALDTLTARAKAGK
ncbi:MAG TPA: hypothetical protein VNW46_10000 [Gemmatimonadaceae bacterium]|nr:hypothetical protein [Gemmatimonadaceae bacterium]